MVTPSDEASALAGVNAGRGIFPFCTQHCSVFSESQFFSPLYFALLGSCAVHRGEGGLGGEWNWPGLYSRVFPGTGSPNPSPPVQVPLLLGAPANNRFLPALLLLPPWKLGQGRWGRAAPAL